MDDWEGLRTAAVIAIWVTIGGGALMAALWVARGGPAAIGPEDEIAAESGMPIRDRARATSFSVVQLTTHALLALLTAALLTSSVMRDTDLTGGYVAVLLALAATGGFGVLMFQKWRSGRRPAVAGAKRAVERVEDAVPAVVVYMHGFAALITFALVAWLLIAD